MIATTLSTTIKSNIMFTSIAGCANDIQSTLYNNYYFQLWYKAVARLFIVGVIPFVVFFVVNLKAPMLDDAFSASKTFRHDKLERMTLSAES